MSKVRSIDSEHDWTFGKGNNNYRSGLDAVTQDVDTRLNCFLGDCFFNRTAGIDWFNLLGSKNQVGLQLAISATILNTDGVLRIKTFSFNLDPRTRIFSANYTIQGATGVVIGAITSATILEVLTTEDGLILTTEDGTQITTG